MVNSPFQLVHGMDQLLARHNAGRPAVHCAPAPGQMLKKKARRPRLVWTDGLHLRFVLAVLQGRNVFTALARSLPSLVALAVGLKHSTSAIIMSDEALAECISKKSIESKYSMLSELVKIYLRVYTRASQVRS